MLPKNSKTARIFKEPHAAMGGNSGNYVRAEVEFDSTKRKLLPIKGIDPTLSYRPSRMNIGASPLSKEKLNFLISLSLLAWLSHSMMSIISRSGKISYLL